MTKPSRPDKVVPMPLLTGGTVEDTFSGFASQIDGEGPLGRRVEHATTVIVAEVRGWQAVWDRLGAERAGAVLEGTVDRILDVFERFGADDVAVGGRSTQPIVTASFVEGDHALRAVAAAGALADAVGTAQSSADERFHTCVGVNTGVVVNTHVNGSGIDFSSSGTTRMFAVRLQEFAGPGQVFVSETTYRAVPVALDVVPIGPVRTHGDGGTQEAYLLRGVAPRPDDPR
jgi:adenylate cyclase